MTRNSVLLIFLFSAFSFVVPGCKANESDIHIMSVTKLLPEAQKAAYALIEASQQPEFDPPQLLSSDAFEVQHSDQSLILIPAILDQTTDSRDFLSQCRLIEVKAKNNQTEANLIERKESGFSDDYEPCVAISPPIFIDVNGDGTQDIVFSITRINGAREKYVLGDVYLIGADAKICHSPEASTAFISDSQAPISKSNAERIIRSEQNRFISLRCSAGM